MQPIEIRRDSGTLVPAALQDVIAAQPFVLIGLIANLTGSALQEDIAESSRRLLRLGQDIIGGVVAEETMLSKRLLCLARVRRLPQQLSWVDQRLVRERYIDRCDAHALAIYLFLATVADDRGLSYYLDATLAQRLSMDAVTLNKARQALIEAQLIAYERPLY